ncbi:MAG: helix-turn-helix domain-containing protein [Oscillospiraceae bacterium]|nr:helix-turn-helix domain-containing protein [Oscillospiraceae bacterium]
MTQKQKNELITQFIELVTEMAEDNPADTVTAEPEPEKVEMLTIKECAEFTGLSVNTIRQLIKQEKIPYIRAGIGERGKYLISKYDLIKLLHQIK